MNFSHIHNHTQFSLLDGASAIPKLFKKAIENEMPGVAITDHGNMFGVFKFVAEAWKNTKVVGKDKEGRDILEPLVKPIIGCEVYVVENRLIRSFSKNSGKDKRYHQLLLAKDQEGYQNLTKICSLGYIEGLYGKYPRVDKSLIKQYHKGLIATTCCIGAMVPQAILKKTEEEAEAEFKWWLDVFGDDYYIELQNHYMPEQTQINNVLLKFAKKYNVPVVATNDAHYVDREDYNAHDILLCVNTGEKQNTPSLKEFADDDSIRPRDTRFAFYNDEFYFKTQEEMAKLFKDHPEAIANTQLIVDKVKPLKLHKEILLPHFEVPEAFGGDQLLYLTHLTWEGARQKYPEMTPEIEDRIKFELFTIKSMGFAGYFLIVSDFIKAGRDLGVFIGPGRGSAAGSVVAYCIGITSIDPIKYQLLFERFLNPERKSMPDIDTDFDDEGRQKVIDYVVDKYGKNQVAHIITYGTMAAKSSIKDVSRVLDLALPRANALSKLVPERPGISLKRLLHAPIDNTNPQGEKSLKQKEELRDDEIINVIKLRDYLNSDEAEGRILVEAEKLEGSVRSTGIHAAGIIIAPKDLTTLMPVCTSKDVHLLITQYEGTVIEDAGVIKMDFLGLRTLTIIKNALALIKRNHGVNIDIENVDLTDKLTFELFQKGNTNGTFQFESAGMQKYLQELQPDTFSDLIAMNALYRPGPLAYIPNFIKRKHGLEKITYDLPEMEEFLSDTYGITVYQEQVMLLAQKLAGFSKGDADVLRKAMGKKQIAVLNKMEEQFIKGAQANGHPIQILEKIWNDWKAFAQYAFNKSHSTCYAFVAFQTAYLKAHYPAEYMAAVLNNSGSIEKITFFMAECQKMGIDVLGPDINESMKEFSVTKNGVIRFGLSNIKGVGEAAIEAIVEEREANGKYESIFEIMMRNDTRSINKKSLEALTMGGAFDCFYNIHRAQYLMSQDDQRTGIDIITQFANDYHNSVINMNNSLFGDIGLPSIDIPELPSVPELPLHELLNLEKEVLGIYLSAHPLDSYRFEMENYNIIDCDKIENNANKKIRLGGYLSNVYIGIDKKGDGYAKCLLNDKTGTCMLMFWKESFVKFKEFLVDDNKVAVEGQYTHNKYSDKFEFKTSHVMLLANVSKKLTKGIHFNMDINNYSSDELNKLTHIIKSNPGDVKASFKIIDFEQNSSINLSQEYNGFEFNDAVLEVISNLNTISFEIYC